MQLKIRIFYLFIVGLSAILCSCDDSSGPTTFVPGDLPNVLETLQNNSELSSFVEAISQTGKENLLTQSSSVTVFAPTNDAFQLFLTNNNFASISDIPADHLSLILDYHLQYTSLPSSDINSGFVLSSSPAGPDSQFLAILYINDNGNVSINERANVVDANTSADNGIIHTLDAVLELPNMMDFIEVNPNFTELARALAITGYKDTLESGGPFTFFAPINAPFEALLDETPAYQTLNDVPVDTLTGIIKDHLVQGNIAFLDLELGTSDFVSRNGDTYSIFIDSEGTFINDQLIILLDVQATNGVIHFVEDFVVEP